MAKGKQLTVKITLPFGVLIALLCDEASRLAAEDREAYRLVSAMLPGFLARYRPHRLAS